MLLDTRAEFRDTCSGSRRSTRPSSRCADRQNTSRSVNLVRAGQRMSSMWQSSSASYYSAGAHDNFDNARCLRFRRMRDTCYRVSTSVCATRDQPRFVARCDTHRGDRRCPALPEPHTLARWNSRLAIRIRASPKRIGDRWRIRLDTTAFSRRRCMARRSGCAADESQPRAWWPSSAGRAGCCPEIPISATRCPPRATAVRAPPREPPTGCWGIAMRRRARSASACCRCGRR